MHRLKNNMPNDSSVTVNRLYVNQDDDRKLKGV